MALHITLLLLGVTAMAVCSANSRNENYDPTDNSNLATRNGDTVNKWTNHESSQEIDEKLKWGAEQLSKGNLNGMVNKYDNSKPNHANGNTDNKLGKKSGNMEEECDNWFSCSEGQKQEIMNNIIFTFIMLSIIPMILVFEKIYKKLNEFTNSTCKLHDEWHNKNDVSKDMQKIHRRMKPKDANNK